MRERARWIALSCLMAPPGASVGWKFSATLLAQFAVDAPLPFDGLGVNHPTGPGFTVGLRDGDMW